MQKLLLLTLLYFCFGMLHARQTDEPKKYLIYLADKNNTPYSIQHPEQFLSTKSIARRLRQQIPVTTRDLPVDPAYVQSIKSKGIEVWYTSRWFNAVVIRATQTQLTEINSLPFIKGTRALNRLSSSSEKAVTSIKYDLRVTSEATGPSLEDKDYGKTFHQAEMLGVTDLHEAGFHGEGMTIAVFDAGFPAVNSIPAFAHLFQENRIAGTYDFVEKKKNAFSANSHGTMVLSTMAAYAPGLMIGTAYKANYLLLRTEDAATEHNIEEVNWLLAAEYADSAGADVINSSLGYSVFDAPSVSYTYDQMDGNTAIVTKAADFAAATGMLVVVSAGNEGNKAWQYVTAPADADSVLTVGAVDSLGTVASFSSRGPAADGRIKPDVVAMGASVYVLNTAGNIVKSNGTSFSGPIMAGFAASLWQAYQTRSNYEIIQFIRQLGHLSGAPNNTLGYGIPNYSRTVTGLPTPGSNNGVMVVNPVTGNELVLLLSEPWTNQRAELQLLDTTGKLILKKQLQPNLERQTLDLQPLALQKGVYLCRISSGKQITTVRFVKL
ncbi:S8 family serine peptidase [Pontibacter sp. KCTC 32443]|uniref:S8 family serine peptidase n=1 Tax=Pontibacter TaxID=323449 RepID=UPI00164D34CC|nr:MULTISPECIES: S8 family serine peptidase [Pontibacter]MBC5773330.1 S8 family serine peptidase [Pontibacter sp. KCTC 32443]